MKLKLLALAGIMTATMGLTACDSKTEDAAENLDDATAQVEEGQEDLNEAVAEGEVVTDEAVEAVEAAETEIADATAEVAAEVPVDGAAAEGDMAAVDASDEVVIEEEAPAAQ